MWYFGHVPRHKRAVVHIYRDFSTKALVRFMSSASIVLTMTIELSEVHMYLGLKTPPFF